MKEYDRALQNYLKTNEILKKIFKGKHPSIAMNYIDFGLLYEKKKEYDRALQYFQKAVVESIENCKDTTDVFAVPKIKSFENWDKLLFALDSKADILSNKEYSDFSPSGISKKKLALQYYKICDTLVSKARKNMKSKNDKIILGEQASDVYKKAVALCLDLTSNPLANTRQVNEYKKQAFYFSEKNKSSVLLESLAGAEAQKFAGIPDTLLKQKHKLKINIALYKKIIAEGGDAKKEKLFRDKLFTATHSYDSLIAVFEQKYPEYYELKYNQ